MKVDENLGADQAQLVYVLGHLGCDLNRAHMRHCSIFVASPLGNISWSPTPCNFQELRHPEESETTLVYGLRALTQSNREPTLSRPAAFLPAPQAMKRQGDGQPLPAAVLFVICTHSSAGNRAENIVSQNTVSLVWK